MSFKNTLIVFRIYDTMHINKIFHKFDDSTKVNHESLVVIS